MQKQNLGEVYKMAVDIKIKLDIRAYYEANNLTFKEVARYANTKGYGVSQKSIEYWGRKEEWVKGRYSSLVEAYEELMDNSIINEEIKEKTIKVVQESKSIPVTAEELFANNITTEILYQASNKHFLIKEQIENLHRAKCIAASSDKIAPVKSYHDMLISTYQTIHGKQTSITVGNPNVRDSSELESMSHDALLEIIDE